MGGNERREIKSGENSASVFEREKDDEVAMMIKLNVQV